MGLDYSKALQQLQDEGALSSEWHTSDDAYYIKDGSTFTLQELQDAEQRFNIQQYKSDVTEKVKSHVTATVKKHGWDDINDVVPFAVVDNEWMEEARVILTWHCEVWKQADVVIKDISAPITGDPTKNLPELVLPSTKLDEL